MTVVFSGIMPTGVVQLGNYLGALRHWAADQHDNESYYCVVNLHAISTPQDPEVLREKTMDLAAILLAVGIDPDVATLFCQSHVHEHAELTWVLNCFASFGELQRMTQFKEKAARQEAGLVSVGLFDYPVLQAADILAYRTDRVPVGEDQRQHVELTRDIATRFNARYGETLVLPQAVIRKVGARIMDLQHPSRKMSKSEPGPGNIEVIEPIDAIRKKIRSAVTDSGREIRGGEDKPALTNLLSIMSAVTGRPVEELEASYAGRGYADFKSDLADAVAGYLEPFQARYHEFRSDPGEIERTLARGAEKAQPVAAGTLARVYEAVGFPARTG